MNINEDVYTETGLKFKAGRKEEVPYIPEYKVRNAVLSDIPALFQMAKDMHAEGAVMPFEPIRSKKFIDDVISGKLDAVVGVIGEIGKPEAIICARWGQYWYTDRVHLEEMLNYVKPEYRKSGRAKCLIEYLKHCARQIGVPLLIGVLSNERTEAKVELYRRRLGDPAGAYFIYNGRAGYINYLQREEENLLEKFQY